MAVPGEGIPDGSTSHAARLPVVIFQSWLNSKKRRAIFEGFSVEKIDAQNPLVVLIWIKLVSKWDVCFFFSPALGCNPFKDSDVHVIEASWKVLSSHGRQHHHDLRMRDHGAEHRQAGTNLVSDCIHPGNTTGAATASFLEVSAVAIQRVLKFPVLTRRLNASSQLNGIFSICVSA